LLVLLYSITNIELRFQSGVLRIIHRVAKAIAVVWQLCAPYSRSNACYGKAESMRSSAILK
jgi:hypothetical protein